MSAATLSRPALRREPTRRVACRICGSRRSELAKVVPNRDPRVEDLFPRISVSICRDCGLIYQNPCLSRAQMDRLYEASSDKIFSAAPGVTRLESESRLKALLALRRPPARLLEVGSSDGTFLALAKAAGYEVVGLEPSRESVRKARQAHPGLDAREGFLEDFSPAEKFDVICHFYVLEYSFAPRRFIERCRALLAPGGVMFFEAPDVESFATLPFANSLFTHQDITLLSRASARNLLGLEGFSGVKTVGSASKSYGMRLAAKPTAKKTLKAHYAASGRCLKRYFAKREALITRLETRVKSWQPLLRRYDGPVVIFGAGENGRILNATSLRRCGRPMYFCDNSAAVQGRSIDGLKVLAPAAVAALKPALVVAASIDYQRDMARQMTALGIPAERIVTLYEGF